MTFREKLSRLTEDRIKSRLSRRAGLTPNAITDYIHRGHTPGIDAAVRIAEVLGVDPGWLIDDKREWPPVPSKSESRDPIAA